MAKITKYIGLLCLLFASVAWAQDFSLNSNFVIPRTDPASQDLTDTGISSFMLVWRPETTVVTCSVRADSSSDGITWGSGDLIASQNCATAGSSSYGTLAAGKKFVRINVTTLTGNGGVSVSLKGWGGNGSGNSSSFPVTAAQQVQSGGSIAPSALGQNVANQERWTVGPPQPTGSCSTSGGTINTNQQTQMQIVFNSTAGTTLAGQSITLGTAPFTGCGGSTTASATITAPTAACGALPCGGYTSYSVYFCNSTFCTAGPSGNEGLVAACTAITTNCSLTAPLTGTGTPATNTAFAWPTPLGTNLCSPGTFVTGFLQDSNGTYYPYMGVDSSNTGTNPPAPYNKLLFCRPVWFTDTGTDPPPGKNGLMVVSHTQNGLTVNQNNQDRGISVFSSNCIPSLQTCADSTAHYGLEAIQTEQDFDGTATINGSPDAEVSGGTFTAFIQTNGTNYASNSFGSHGVRANISRFTGSGADSNGMDGIYAAFSNQSTLTSTLTYASAVHAQCGGTVNSTGLACADLLVTNQFSTGNFPSGSFAVKVQNNATFAPAHLTGTKLGNGAGVDLFLRNDQRGWDSVFNGTIYADGLGASNVGPISVLDDISIAGSATITVPALQNFSLASTCTGGASTYTYKMYPVDNNGGLGTPNTITTPNTCVNPLTVGNPATLVLGYPTPVGQGAVSYKVWRTGGPMGTGFIGNFTCSPISTSVATIILGCSANFVDNGLTADGSTAPTVTTAGGIKTAGYSPLNGNKYFVTGNFTTAANTNLQTITGLAITLPPVAQNYNFHCSLAYSQGTANAAVAFGIQSATVAPTNIFATGWEQITVGPPATEVNGTLATLTTTTATNIVSGTPGAIATNYMAELNGTIEEPANDAGNTINIMVSTATSGDAVTVLRGSYCYVY